MATPRLTSPVCEDVDDADICYAHVVFDGPEEVRNLYTDFYPTRRPESELLPPQHYAAMPKNNPFLDIMRQRYAQLKPTRDIPPNTKVNGYLKFYKRPERDDDPLPRPAIAAPPSPSSPPRAPPTGPAAWQASVMIVHDPRSRERRLIARRLHSPSIPAHMADPVKLKLDTMDTRLFEWCRSYFGTRAG
jgi:hypothetical protein